MDSGIGSLVAGEVYDLKVAAKNPHGEGIGRVNNVVVFIRNTKARIGKTYRVKITDIHGEFAYAESTDHSKPFIGNGTLLI